MDAVAPVAVTPPQAGRNSRAACARALMGWKRHDNHPATASPRARADRSGRRADQGPDCRGVPSAPVNVIWRTLLITLLARRRVRREGRLEPTAVGVIRLTTMPTDLDVLRHMNNGRYLSLFDLGRWDLLIRTGMADAMRSHGWYAVVSSETITFRKSLNPWQRFDVESRLIGHDDKAHLPRAPSRGRRRALRARHRQGAHDEALGRHALARGAVRRARAGPRGFRMSSPGCMSGPRHPLCRRPAQRRRASGADFEGAKRRNSADLGMP